MRRTILNQSDTADILRDLEELKNILTLFRLLAINAVKKGDRIKADESLYEAIRYIENIRDRFFT